MDEQLRKLYEFAKKAGATEAHLEMGDLFKERELTGTISVYIGARPAHHVLDDFQEWAEAHGEEGILDILEIIKQPGYINPWEVDQDE